MHEVQLNDQDNGLLIPKDCPLMVDGKTPDYRSLEKWLENLNASLQRMQKDSESRGEIIAAMVEQQKNLYTQQQRFMAMLESENGTFQRTLGRIEGSIEKLNGVTFGLGDGKSEGLMARMKAVEVEQFRQMNEMTNIRKDMRTIENDLSVQLKSINEKLEVSADRQTRMENNFRWMRWIAGTSVCALGAAGWSLVLHFLH